MDNTIPWWASKTIWSGIIVILASAARICGRSISDGDQQMVLDFILTIVQAVAGLVGIYGRVSATAKVV